MRRNYKPTNTPDRKTKPINIKFLNHLMERGYDQFASEAELARTGIATVGTLRTWASNNYGPPRIMVGREAIYLIGSLSAWLSSQEKPKPQDLFGQGSGDMPGPQTGQVNERVAAETTDQPPAASAPVA